MEPSSRNGRGLVHSSTVFDQNDSSSTPSVDAAEEFNNNVVTPAVSEGFSMPQVGANTTTIPMMARVLVQVLTKSRADQQQNAAQSVSTSLSGMNGPPGAVPANVPLQPYPLLFAHNPVYMVPPPPGHIQMPTTFQPRTGIFPPQAYGSGYNYVHLNLLNLLQQSSAAPQVVPSQATPNSFCGQIPPTSACGGGTPIQERNACLLPPNPLHRPTPLYSFDCEHHQPPPPSNDDSSISPTGSIKRGRRRSGYKPPMLKTCQVCFEPTNCNYYGATTCSACSCFFRRIVVNNLNYSCPRGGNCPMSKLDRTRCTACRFDACLRAGMKPERVHIPRPVLERNQSRALIAEIVGASSQSPPAQSTDDQDMPEEPERLAVSVEEPPHPHNEPAKEMAEPEDNVNADDQCPKICDQLPTADEAVSESLSNSDAVEECPGTADEEAPPSVGVALPSPPQSTVDGL